jgi:hypothetical protein
MSTIIEHLRVILLHPAVKDSLLISGTLQGAIKEIERLEDANKRLQGYVASSVVPWNRRVK